MSSDKSRSPLVIVNPQERAVKVVEFLKTLGSNSDRKLEDNTRDCQLAQLCLSLHQ
jgi:hypothetical protein